MPKQLFQKGNPGKAPGTKNHVTAELTRILEESMHEGDLAADLKALRSGSSREKAIYYALLGKLIPHNVDVNVGGDIHINFISCWDRAPVDPVPVRDAQPVLEIEAPETVDADVES